MTTNNLFQDCDIISTYTRKQAIDDGVLVDISKIAQEAGFRVPVAVTAAVYGLIENIPEKYKHEDVQGRLWDMVDMAHCAIKCNWVNSEQGCFMFILHTANTPTAAQAQAWKLPSQPAYGAFKDRVRLKMVSGPGDQGEHVITIMLPDED